MVWTNVPIKLIKIPYLLLKKEGGHIVKPNAGKVMVKTVDIYFLLSGEKMA